nr:unnamed protein product [Callosobruchus analis]
MLSRIGLLHQNA